MKTAALVMGYDSEAYFNPFKDFDEVIEITGEPHEVEKWKEAAAKTDAEIVGFFCFKEQIEGPLDAALKKMKEEGKRVVLMPHERVETTYRLRLARKPLPERLEDFLWPTVDPSKLMGLVNYHGFVATNVFTSGGPVVKHRPPHEESGVLLAARLVREGNALEDENRIDEAFAAFARASLAAPLPEAFYGLAGCACGTGRDTYALVHLEQGLTAADEIMNILPWRRGERFALPADFGIQFCLTEKSLDLEKAKKFLRIGERAVPDHLGWDQRAAEIQMREVAHSQPVVGFDAEVPYEIVEPLLEVFDAPEPGLIHAYPRVYSMAASTPHSPHRNRAASYVLPLDRRSSLDPAELAGLHRARGLIAVSEFQAEQYRRAYPFLPADFVKVCPLGFKMPELDRPICTVMGNAPNEVERKILARVAQLKEFSSMSGKVFLLVPIDEPYRCEAVLQAQAAGAVPVVAAVGCLPELVKGGYCIRPPVTSEAFIDAAAKRIAHLLTHESDRLAVAEEGRRRVLAENTWEAVAPLWRKVFS